MKRKEDTEAGKTHITDSQVGHDSQEGSSLTHNGSYYNNFFQNKFLSTQRSETEKSKITGMQGS